MENTVFAQTEALLGALNAAWVAQNSSSVAVFIDPTLIDPVADLFRADNTITICALTILEGRFDKERLPYIAHIPDAEHSRHLMHLIVEQSVKEALDIADDTLRPRCVCGWIVDPGEPYALARSLGSAALVTTPEKERWPLRYWDPRVIGHLPRVLAPDQYAALRSCLGNWWYIDDKLHFALALPARQDARGALPLRFDPAQWHRLQRIGHINELMRLASDWHLAPGQDLARQIDETMQRAERLGFTGDDDLNVFAVCALIGHARFDEHPRVAQSIAKARATGLGFTAAIDEYDDDFWAGLKDGRWLEQPQQGVSI